MIKISKIALADEEENSESTEDEFTSKGRINKEMKLAQAVLKIKCVKSSS